MINLKTSLIDDVHDTQAKKGKRSVFPVSLIHVKYLSKYTFHRYGMCRVGIIELCTNGGRPRIIVVIIIIIFLITTTAATLLLIQLLNSPLLKTVLVVMEVMVTGVMGMVSELVMQMVVMVLWVVMREMG